ncbi:MAG: ribonuclease HII [Bacteroidia bacterium]|nr:ribonuclease HII [Bacteroidia bacterium]
MNNQKLKSYFQVVYTEAGIDEAGRGCLAGPVYAAAVVLPKNFTHPLINDSKQLSGKIRYELREEIQQKALIWAVGIADNHEIDKHNIVNATLMAMHRAIDKLNSNPGYLLIDGTQFKKHKGIPYQCIVKGDSKYFSIAAASILAKTYRDDYMKEIDLLYPDYGWKQNKGYPTLFHRQAIARFGITPFHRRSFNMNFDQFELDFKPGK